MNCLVDGYHRPCMRESAHADSVSPGKVQDAEVLCRAGYTMHDKKGNPALSLIRTNELAGGELSVWRLVSAAPAEALGELVDILRERAPRVSSPQELQWIFGVPAGKLRDLLDYCPVCAVDDTDCGPNWDRHSKHCTLGACSNLGFQGLTNPEHESPEFFQLRRALHEEFRKNEIWSADAP